MKWRLVVLAVAVVAGGAAWLAVSRKPAVATVTAGPLANPAAQSIGVGREAGQVWVYGDAVTFNDGEQPVVLEKISLVNPTPGLRVIDTRINGPEREMLSLGSWPKWPSGEFKDVHPVAGYRVPPRSDPAGEYGVELLFVLRSDTPGRYGAPGVVVDYRVGEVRHRRFLTYGFSACVTARGEPREKACPSAEHLSEKELETLHH